MNKKLLIGISALVVLSVWLVLTFDPDASVVGASFVTPVYADNGGGSRACTDACLYDVEVVQQIPIAGGLCKIGLGVKHKEYDQLQCCCHEVDHIFVEITTDEEGCTCDVPWVCTKQSSTPGDPCGYDFYVTPLFAVPDDTPFYYKIWDLAAPASCYVEGDYQIDCHE